MQNGKNNVFVLLSAQNDRIFLNSSLLSAKLRLFVKNIYFCSVHPSNNHPFGALRFKSGERPRAGPRSTRHSTHHRNHHHHHHSGAMCVVVVVTLIVIVVTDQKPRNQEAHGAKRGKKRRSPRAQGAEERRDQLCLFPRQGSSPKDRVTSTILNHF